MIEINIELKDGTTWSKLDKATVVKSQSAVVDNFKKVCICRSITGGTIMKAIREGCLSFEALRRKIRVGTGSCNAKRCRENIENRIKNYKAAQADTDTDSGKDTLPR